MERPVFKDFLSKEKEFLKKNCIADLKNAIYINLLLNIVELQTDLLISRISHEEYREKLEDMLFSSVHFKELLDAWDLAKKENGDNLPLKQKLLRTLVASNIEEEEV